MFQDSSDGTEKYTTSVTGFINKCIEDVIPTVTVRTHPNQKPWITGNIHNKLKGRTFAFKEQDSNPEAYKKSHYALRRTIKQANHQYRTKIESYDTSSDARRMWQGLQTFTDYKEKHSQEMPSDTSLHESTRRAMLASR
jgi:phosphorylcholine metabolism protein LicD